LFETIYIIKFI